MTTLNSIQVQYNKMLKITLSSGVEYFTHKTDLSVGDQVTVGSIMGMINVKKVG